MNKQDQKFLIAIAFLLMVASAIALGIVMRQNQHQYQTVNPVITNNKN